MTDEITILQKQIDAAPGAPGCYVFRDDEREVLYVGKAIDLKKRIRSYLKPGSDGRNQIYFLMERATNVEFVVVSSEKEALILENNLIKKYRPRYNISLAGDDKTFVSVRVDLRHEWPRATIVHKHKRDGATYLGPFSSSAKLYETMKVLKRAFPMRLCSDHTLANRTRPCIYHDIGLCCAPCVPGKVEPAEYGKMVKSFMDVLRGKDQSVLRDMEAQMQDAAAKLEFERAADLRDRAEAIAATTSRQRAEVKDGGVFDRDVIGFYREADRAMIAILCYREGKLLDTTTREIQSLLPDEEVLSGFIEQYYQQVLSAPEEIVIPLPLESTEALASWIADRAEHKVEVTFPQRGDKVKLLELANVNAKHSLRVKDETLEREQRLIRALQEALSLENVPNRIECYDISHTQGRDIVASGVCFIDGKPAKGEYRKYKVKTVPGNDDFASMEEVLRRRLVRARLEDNFPDLIVIDGGAGQLGRVLKVLEELNIVDIDVIGLAKSRDKADAGWQMSYSGPQKWTGERVFKPGIEEPIALDQRSPALFLLMRVRDEAHRFAITYHRELARKNAVASGLDSIDGIGPKRKKALIKTFGSPKGVKLASVDQLRAVAGVSPELAQRIFDHFTVERAEIIAKQEAAGVRPEAGAVQSLPDDITPKTGE
ncbi:MAG: excinuclease ABC subunit UvrC [Planctomycetes bacterium]|nr:excinuclease ABC subunit UvrC [Planctomycetota bacterium]